MLLIFFLIIILNKIVFMKISVIKVSIKKYYMKKKHSFIQRLNYIIKLLKNISFAKFSKF